MNGRKALIVKYQHGIQFSVYFRLRILCEFFFAKLHYFFAPRYRHFYLSLIVPKRWQGLKPRQRKYRNKQTNYCKMWKKTFFGGHLIP